MFIFCLLNAFIAKRVPLIFATNSSLGTRQRFHSRDLFVFLVFFFPLSLGNLNHFSILNFVDAFLGCLIGIYSGSLTEVFM